MAILYSYPETLELLPEDMLIGTSTIRVAGKKKNITKNFTLELLKNFILDGNTGVQWGTITGNLSNQTDLQAALNAKQNSITLTTTGSTGPATFASNVLNIPDYSTGMAVPTLNQVLTAGNTSLLDAEVNTIGVYDATELAYGYLSINNSDFTLSDSLGVNSIISRMGITFSGQIGGSSGTILLSALTASRTYTLPNATGTVALTSDIGTWGALNYPTWTTGTPFVKMTAAGTFALDTNTYLTSAVTSVAATSPITSSGGNTPTISTSMATNKLIGRSTAGTGVMEEIAVGTGLSLSAGTLSVGSISGTIPHATATGTDAYLATIAGVAAYGDGEAYLIRFTNGNTTGCTLNINALGAVPLYRNNDGQLIGGDIWAGGEMLCTYNAPLNIFQCIGTSPNSLFSYITNADSVAITKGQPVYAFGGTGDRLTVKRAFNTSDAGSARTIGVVVTSSIAVNQKGIIIIEGLLDGLNILPTATWSDGDTVYLGTTAGSITNVKQYAPNHLVYLGTVTTASNGSAGRWYVKVQNGYELDELHNVQAQTPALKDTLWYDNTVTPGQWKTASIPTILGYTPFNLPSLTSGSVLFSNGTTIAQDNANFFWNDTNNRLGIGNAAPEVTLDVTGIGRFTSGARFNNVGVAYSLWGQNGSEIGANGSHFIIQATNGGNTSFGSVANLGAKVGIKASGALSTDIALRVRNSADTADFMSIDGTGATFMGGRLVMNSNSIYLGSNNGNTLMRFLSQNYQIFNNNSGAALNLNANGSVQIGSTSSVNWATFSATGHILYGTTNTNFFSNGNVAIGTNTDNGGKLQIKAPGALSTDIALRVRNSADNGDLLTVNGAGTSVLKGSSTNFYVNSNAAGTATGRFIVVDAVASSGQIGLLLSGVGAERAKFFLDDGTGYLVIQNSWSNYGMAFNTAGANTRMFISGVLGNIGIGTTAPVASAKVQIDSTTQGFLPPRMTNAQRIAIATPAVGLMVYCTDAVEGLYINKSTGWTFII